MYKVYILKCSDGTLYTGITTDLEKRLKQHNGKISGGAKYTFSRKPVELLYSEYSNNRSEASKREYEIKKLKRDDKFKLINKKMSKVIFLIPPSEGKKSETLYESENLSFNFEKPLDISNNVVEKDLKCSGKRFLEGLELNKNINNSKTIEAIKIYSGIMYNGINYTDMQDSGKKFFENNFLILSGMYGIVKPLDKIGNYKLPIETKGLLDFWGTKILEKLNNLKINYIINLLPISYSKLIFGKNKKEEKLFNEKRNFNIININFLKPDGNKISHGVKKIKGEWIKNISENNINFEKIFLKEGYNNLIGGYVIKKGNIIDINITIK